MRGISVADAVRCVGSVRGRSPSGWPAARCSLFFNSLKTHGSQWSLLGSRRDTRQLGTYASAPLLLRTVQKVSVARSLTGQNIRNRAPNLFAALFVGSDMVGVFGKLLLFF